MVLWEQTADKEVEVKLGSFNYGCTKPAFPLVISAGAMLFHLFIFVLLLWSTESSVSTYTGVVGQTVLLPCSYKVNPGNEVVPICWGRGICPVLQCKEEFLRTDGQTVTFQKIKRYQLKGNLVQGNVSLTIENVGEADSGTYCCRIQFTGPFNDQKTSLELVVKPAETTTFRLQTQQTSRNTWSNNPTVYDFATKDNFSCITEILEITSPANGLQKPEDFTGIGIYIGVSIFMCNLHVKSTPRRPKKYSSREIAN
ncbi:hepatitis A virus cellular receptor 2 isoform X2 [Petaurus breviceps papuanus]|uniref:hepatitis A virus cellular receptor 2 isoform X2 n=1 Tax=Petaurus breviceps papuanus TaxID=3040969 RepID=UPI0036DE90DA